MTVLKRENTELSQENQRLKEKLDDMYFLNQKMDEALRAANEKANQRFDKQIEST